MVISNNIYKDLSLSYQMFLSMCQEDVGIKVDVLKEKVDHLVALQDSQISQITSVSGIHPVGTLDVCTKFHGNPSNSF